MAIGERCCGADCIREGNEAEPCWGDVTVVDEETWSDGDGVFDSSWIHACEGHVDWNGIYKQEESGR